MKYLMDTCVLSELLRKKLELKVVRWVDTNEPVTYISVLTWGELQKGVTKLTDETRKERIRSWLEQDLAARFSGRILPLGLGEANVWGRMTGAAEREGRKLAAIDSLIAATALAHDLIVVTRNERDLLACGVRVFNPWT